MIKTNQRPVAKLTLTSFRRIVKIGDELQRYDHTRQEWFCSFTIATEEDVPRALHALKTEYQSARVLRPAEVIITGGD